MGNHRIVVALGGNALGQTASEQSRIVKATIRPLIDLIEDGNQLLLTHGNGPQVGMINLAFERSGEMMPFPECGAMSQGYIGYHLQNALQAEILRRKLSIPVATVVTQVRVDSDDPAFNDPTKPIGSFYDPNTAEVIAREKGWVMKEDAGRGWRRHVPSPLPQEIIEIETIRTLIEAGQLVIAAGGGGIPVIADGSELKGVAAVIDKDYASAKLAELVSADLLIILTAVDHVSLNYGQPDQKDLHNVSVEEIKEYIKAGHFAAGSMLPKVNASLSFVESGSGREALITSLANASDGVKGKNGTRIYC
jgi:carbamate kinase